MMTRRGFNKKMVVGAGALALGGSKIITPAQAQAFGTEDVKLINAVAAYMTNFAALIDQGYPLESLDWHQFAGAAMALRATERYYGLDSAIESLYGQDEVATWAVDWAYQEGSWDAFHSLVNLPYTFTLGDWTADFDDRQSFQQSNVWINGTGPMSSQIPDCTGWAQCPSYPDTFIPSPSDSGLDDFTRETIDPPPVPWYSVTSPWIPKVPAVNGFTIWVKNFPKVNKCFLAKWTLIWLGGMGLGAELIGIVEGIPGYPLAAKAVAYIMGAVTAYYCG